MNGYDVQFRVCGRCGCDPCVCDRCPDCMGTGTKPGPIGPKTGMDPDAGIGEYTCRTCGGTGRDPNYDPNEQPKTR